MTEKIYQCFDVYETFVHHVAVEADSESAGREKLDPLLDASETAPITDKTNRFRTEIVGFGMCRDINGTSWTLLEDRR